MCPNTLCVISLHQLQNREQKLVWKRRKQLPAHNKMAAAGNIDETSCEIVDLRKCNLRVFESLQCVFFQEKLLIALEEVESTKLVIELLKNDSENPPSLR